MSTDISFDEAWRVINKDYWDDVRGIAEEMKRAVKDGECDEDTFFEHLTEQVDGHQRVIYTHQARVGLCCTDHPDAFEENMGEKPESVEQQMFAALEADVIAMIGDFDQVKESLEEEEEEVFG
jgi:superoxide dismutase